MKVIYTEAAQQELVEFQLRQKSLIEELVCDRKLVYGDDILEITVSDVKEAAQRIQPIRPAVRRYQSSEFITRAYVVMGILMMIGAFFYPRIQEIFEENRLQASIFITGAAITAMGGLFGYWLKLRKSRFVDQLNSVYFLESSRVGSKERQPGEGSREES